MAYARMVAGVWQDMSLGFAAGDADDAVQYPAGWIDGAEDDERKALGAVAIVEDPAPATSQQLLGQELVDVGGVPHRSWVLPPVEQTRTARLAELAALRWDKQQIVAWNGRSVPADDVTTGRIVASIVRAQVAGGAGFPIRWKLGDSDFVDLSLADLTGYGIAIGAHLQACYDHEADLAAQVAASADPTSIDITAGWPA